MLHKRSIIIFIFVFYSALFFSQSPFYSRDFPSIKSHVPVRIVDGDSAAFYVLRYNKKIHDFTLERRSKKTFDILHFTALKLDSLNASWFDYENLDYLLFEYNYRMYFVFEKVLNQKKSIYIKSIDSSGKASDFKELANLEKGESSKDIRFVMKRSSAQQLLVVGEHYYQNATAKKVVLLYNFDKNQNEYLIKLPLENQATGFSQNYVCSNGRLYYLLANQNLAGYRKKYTVNQELQVPYYESTLQSLNVFNLAEKEIHQTDLCFNKKAEIISSNIVVTNEQVNLFMHYTNRDENKKAEWRFLNQAFNFDLTKKIHCRETLVDSAINQQLYFFDGYEKADAAEKEFKPYGITENGAHVYQLNHRSDENAFHEILLWKSNLMNGEVELQKLIPRNTFYFQHQTRFHYLQEIAIAQKNEDLFFLMLENRNNFKLNPEIFNAAETDKQRHLWSANLMLYKLHAKGEFTKKVVHKNGNYNAVPINFEGNQNEFIFYLNKGKREKFAILIL